MSPRAPSVASVARWLVGRMRSVAAKGARRRVVPFDGVLPSACEAAVGRDEVGGQQGPVSVAQHVQGEVADAMPEVAKDIERESVLSDCSALAESLMFSEGSEDSEADEAEAEDEELLMPLARKPPLPPNTDLPSGSFEGEWVLTASDIRPEPSMRNLTILGNAVMDGAHDVWYLEQTCVGPVFPGGLLQRCGDHLRIVHRLGAASVYSLVPW